MAFTAVVDEIKRLGQEEGLQDDEIAEVLGCSRATVNRARREYGIPRANLLNRKDKEYTCAGCASLIVIRRKERRQLYCPECKGKISQGIPLPNVTK